MLEIAGYFPAPQAVGSAMMKGTFYAFVLFVFLPATSYACPNYMLFGEEIHASSSDLWSPHSFNVTAGGRHDLAFCRINALNSRSVHGFAAERPDFTLRYYRQAGYELEYRVVADCDSVLLINTGAANWYFNDDRDGTMHPRIRLTTPSEGWHDIWVGTYGSQPCAARLSIETF